MKTMTLFLLTIFTAVSVFTVQDLKKVRSLTDKAAMDEDANEELLELLEPYDVSNPLLYGYKGIAQMIQAKHVFNPFKRLSYFKKGKAMLAEAIEADPSNIELRYLRFSAQIKAPGFLGYKENLDEDKTFLISSLPKVKDEESKERIRSFLIESEGTTDAEKKQLRNLE